MKNFKWELNHLVRGLKIQARGRKEVYTLCAIWTQKNGVEWATINEEFNVIPLGDCYKACGEMNSYGYYPAEEA